MAFSPFMMLCNHHLYVVPRRFHHPERNFRTHWAVLPHSSLAPLLCSKSAESKGIIQILETDSCITKVPEFLTRNELGCLQSEYSVRILAMSYSEAFWPWSKIWFFLKQIPISGITVQIKCVFGSESSLWKCLTVDFWTRQLIWFDWLCRNSITLLDFKWLLNHL